MERLPRGEKWLISSLCQRLELAIDDPFIAFAVHLYRSVSEEELAQRSLDDLIGIAMESWRLMACYDPAAPMIKVFNPDLETDGWQTPHTLVMVLSRDMPFVIDSVRIQINRLGHQLHSILNGIFHVQRVPTGQRVAQQAASDTSVEPLESLLVLEVNRCSDKGLLKRLAAALIQVLADVERVTDDFALMRDAMLDCADKVKQGQLKGGLEVERFLRWLVNNHFTFLGYRSVYPDGGRLRVDVGSSLGLARGLSGRPRLLSPIPSSPVEADALLFTKSDKPVTVHRPAYGDYILLREFDDEGTLLREHRFLGLYTSSVYFQSTADIPLLRMRVREVMHRAGLHPNSHDAKALRQILESYPRDELFLSPPPLLYQHALAMLHMHERRQVRVFLRADPLGRSCSVLLFTPRDIFNTDLRKRVQAVLMELLDAASADFSTTFSESILARTQFILHRRKQAKPLPPMKEIEARVRLATTTWAEHFQALLIDALGEELAVEVALRFAEGFPAAYREDFSPAAAVRDVKTLLALSENEPLAMRFYRPLDQGEKQLNFKLYHRNLPLPLSDVIPVMENLGMWVIDEHPYRLSAEEGSYWIHDFRMEPQRSAEVAIESQRALFEQAFLAIWRGQADNDAFNQLVLAAGIDWREVALLRAMAAYMKQTRFPFSMDVVANALRAQPDITRQLVGLFHARFDPHSEKSNAFQLLCDALPAAIEQLDNLTEDRVCRRLLEQIQAMTRTNFYQTDAEGCLREVLAFKFNCQAMSSLPEPRPWREIFVYSPELEGVHQRQGLLARGGVRWSDRTEDYRNEILALVRAQQVKNALILPVGAKGGFVCKTLCGDEKAPLRQERIAQGFERYIHALLDLTDNRLGESVVHPPNSRCHDGEDAYLVVAADRGTSRLSDRANAIAMQREYWLGDAFAAGGKQGYDHKAMGITARGAWLAVQRHFAERGIDTQSEPITVVGIGDMSGEVFGNGMLLSPSIQLVAAFNQRHIFIDPDPDCHEALKERQRLFEANAGWEAYAQEALSAGGGVYRRDRKWLELSAQACRRFGLDTARIAPHDLIRALLKAPVDLLWSAGVGTYVKASDESHQEVADKSNDVLRIDANELRCRVVGEGMNLGLTARARTEYGLCGGGCNADFVDGAAGVACADREVNIKIMLAERVVDEQLTVKQRNELLASLQEEVAEGVLRDCQRQALIISLCEQQCRERPSEYRRLIEWLVNQGPLEPVGLQLPDQEQLRLRQSDGRILTRNEIALLLAQLKSWLKMSFSDTALREEVLFTPLLADAFPASLIDRYPASLDTHRLAQPLLATQLSNQMLHQMGINFVPWMLQAAECSLDDIGRVYVLVREIFDLEYWWQQVEALEGQVSAENQLQLFGDLQRLVRRACRWFLRGYAAPLDCSLLASRFKPSIRLLIEGLGIWLQGGLQEKWSKRFYFLDQSGVPTPLARMLASVEGLYVGLSMVEVSEASGASLEQVVTLYGLLGEQLGLFGFSRQLDALTVESSWQAQARESYRDELDLQVRRLACSVLRCGQEPDVTLRLRRWGRCSRLSRKHWLAMLERLEGEPVDDYARFAVATRSLAELASGCSGACPQGLKTDV